MLFEQVKRREIAKNFSVESEIVFSHGDALGILQDDIKLL